MVKFNPLAGYGAPIDRARSSTKTRHGGWSEQILAVHELEPPNSAAIAPASRAFPSSSDRLTDSDRPEVALSTAASRYGVVALPRMPTLRASCSARATAMSTSARASAFSAGGC